MKLDEAIEHCKEKSKGNCECAKEHEQLSQWLIDYKELKERDTPKKIKVITINGYDLDSMSYVEDKEYCCPTCGETLGGIGSYCEYCGQKLEGE